MNGVAKLRPGSGQVGLLDAPEPAAIPGHLVIEVTAGGLCGTDVHIFHDEYPSRPPVILGHEVAGKVVGCGRGRDALHNGQLGHERTVLFPVRPLPLLPGGNAESLQPACVDWQRCTRSLRPLRACAGAVGASLA